VQSAAPTPQRPPIAIAGAGAAEAAASPADQGPSKRSQLQARRIGPIVTAGGPALLQDQPAARGMVSVPAQPSVVADKLTAAGVPQAQASQAAEPAAATCIAAGSANTAAAAAGGRLRPRAVQSIAHSSGSGLLGGAHTSTAQLAAARQSARLPQDPAAAPAVQPAAQQVAGSAAADAVEMEVNMPAAAAGVSSGLGARPPAHSSAEVRHPFQGWFFGAYNFSVHSDQGCVCLCGGRGTG
jgi:hypothetical protein